MKTSMRLLVLVVVFGWVAGLVLCSGCRNRVYSPLTPVGFYPKRYKDPHKTMEFLDNLQKFCDKEIPTYISKPETIDKEKRNNIIYARKKVVDIIYEEYTARLTGRKTLFDLGTGIAQAGFNAAGTVVPLAETKGIMAAAALGLTGTQNAVNKSVFYDKAVPVLQVKMDADRKAAWKIISDKMDLPATEAAAKEEAAKAAGAKPPKAENPPAPGQAPAANQKPKTYYGLLEALSDLEDYYTAGSLSDALMSVANPANAPPGDQTDKSKPQSKGDNSGANKPGDNKAPAPTAPADKPEG